MGWAQRVKQSAGNTDKTPVRNRFISAKYCQEKLRRCEPFSTVTFSDRAYAVDHQTGQLRRVPVPNDAD